MEPNINQKEGINQIPQTAPQPVQAPQQPAATAAQNLSESPKQGLGKGVILIIILLVLVLGIAAYILFAKAQINKNQKTTAENTSLVLPSPTLVPTLAPEEDLEIGSPEEDLSDLDVDVVAL